MRFTRSSVAQPRLILTVCRTVSLTLAPHLDTIRHAMPNLEKRGAAAWLTLGRIDDTVIAALPAACDSAADDANVRTLVIALSGPGDDGAAPPGDPFGCLAALPKPVICTIAGALSGASLALALAADIRIAADGATFSLVEAAAGRLPSGGITQRLTRLVGRGKALELILTGEPIDAAEALRIGLVSEAVPAAKLSSRAQEIADRLSERGPLALQFAKEAVSRGIDMPLEQALRFETDLTVILQTTDDRAEGVRAFLDKRKPQFKGK